MSSKPLAETKVKELLKEKELQKEFLKEKEHKEKLEKEHKDKDKDKELKEKPEKEIKDKDKEKEKEHKEKEHKDKFEKEIKEHKEYKEFKEIEKLQKDKDKDFEKVQKDKDKDAEFQPGGDPAVAQAALFKFHGKEHIEKTHKDVDKVQKDKEIETAAQAVAQPQALRKFVEKTHKDFEKVHKDFKELKEFKFEKLEIKEKDWDVAGPGHVGPGDPVEQRMAVLEATVAQLIHFIPAELRPDLSTGALAQEANKPAAAAAPDKSEKPDHADKGKK